MVIRFRLLTVILFASYAALLFHLYDIQIRNGEYYLAKAESQYLASGFINSKRGIIYFTDRDGALIPATLNKDFRTVYAVPKRIEDAKEAANALSLIIEKPPEELEKAFSDKKSVYKVLAKKADNELIKKIENLAMEGIVVGKELARFYPSGKTASHLLGFVGSDEKNIEEKGKYGIEEFYDSPLSAKPADVKTGPPEVENGSDITLTIDFNIQCEAEKILSKLMEAHAAVEGTIIVADPRTGKIISMASAPAFDPNSFFSYPYEILVNPATKHISEPGSVFKVLTMAAAIDAKKITPLTTYVDAGQLKISGRIIQNFDFSKFGPHGKTTMTEVIERSLNTGAVFAERQIGRDLFLEYLKKFGLDEETGIDLPAEEKGSLRQLNPKARDVAFATASYGQGVSVTPIELVQAISVIANGGNLMRPYVNSALEPRIIRRVISEKTAREVTNMMISAVDKNLVGKINGYKIAGKSGTAYIPNFKIGGYTEDVINTDVGFGAASAPH